MNRLASIFPGMGIDVREIKPAKTMSNKNLLKVFKLKKNFYNFSFFVIRVYKMGS